MATSTVLTNKPINPRGDDNRPVDSYNRASLYSGKALDFDGVNDDVLSTITISGAKTFCAWINADGTSNERIISISGVGYSNITFSNNKFNMYDGINIPETTTTFETGQWYFVVGVQEANSAKIYVNGINQPLGATTWIERTHTGATIAIGRDAAGAAAYYDGKISGVRIFNTALTAAQVSDLYNNPEKIVPTGVSNDALKLWLPMMEGAGTTAYDGSGNGNHGTISGATWTHGVGAPVAQSAVMDWNKGTNETNYSDIQQTVGSVSARNWVEGTGNPWTPLNATGPTGLTNSAGTYTKTNGTLTSDFLYNSHIPLVSGETYTMSAWVKLGTASNAVFVLNNSTSWNTIPGANYVATADNGYDEWKQLSITFTAPSSNKINIHIGYHEENGVDAQADGTFYLYGVALHKGSTPILVPTNGTAQTSPVLLPQGLTSGRDITGVNLFENVRKQGALNLDGNSWAEVHDNASLDFGTGSFTLEAWARVNYVDTGSSLNAIMTLGAAQDGAGSIGVISSGGIRPYTYYNSNGTPASVVKTKGDWMHIVGIYDGINMNIYLDGAFDNSIARTAGDITNDLVKMIGRDTTTVRYYNDQIAQPRIYNRALTASEVLNNYNATKTQYQ